MLRSTEAAEVGATERARDNEVFRFMDLPAELREEVYLWASHPFPPIETNAINNTPNRVRIPSIAQLSTSTREEALAVFYRNREIVISLHCHRNVDRAVEWAKASGDSSYMSSAIVISGTMLVCSNDWYHLRIRCSKDDPQFRVEVRPHPDERSNIQCLAMRDALAAFLDRQIASKRHGHERGRLTKTALLGVLNVVLHMSTRYLPDDPMEPGIARSFLDKAQAVGSTRAGSRAMRLLGRY